MTPLELLARDLRVHLLVEGVSACGAAADGLTSTSEALWSTCSACLVVTVGAAS